MASLCNAVATGCNQSFYKSQRGGNLQLQSSCDQLRSSPVASPSAKLQLDFKTLATMVGCGCLNAIFDLGGSESGRRGSVFRVSAMREGLEDRPSGQWGGCALLPSTTLGEDVIHGTEGESVSGVCHTMGGVLTGYGRRRCPTGPTGLGEFSQTL